MHITSLIARRTAVLAALFFLIGACSGSSAPSSEAVTPSTPVAEVPQNSTLFIGLTDAPGDFLQYQVAVTSIQLTRANGVVVETLPLATQFDFAQYTELTEFFTAASVPVGVYTAVTLSLDYSNAEVLVENDEGDVLKTTVVDASGLPVAQSQVRVGFADNDVFRIAPGVPAHITLDFDLENSHEVVLGDTEATAQLDGVLLVDSVLEFPRTRRARGPLQSVDIDASNFTLQLRPFYRPTGRFGELTIASNNETEWELDGTSYAGNAGLVALSGFTAGTPVVVLGELNVAEQRYLATNVLAGSSAPFGTRDVATGVIVARVGNQLTLNGAILVDRDYRVRRVAALPITVGGDTAMTQVKSAFPQLLVDDLSIGQRVTVSGDLNEASSDIPNLDASDGHVRVLYSQGQGEVRSLAPLTLNLSRLNGRNPDRYDFSGSGADPEHYVIDTGSLPLDQIASADAVAIRGFAAPYKDPSLSFLAQSIGNISILPGKSRAWFATPSTTAVIQADSTALVIDIALASRAVHHYAGSFSVDLKDTLTPWTIQPTASGRGIYLLRTPASRLAFSRFDLFIEALNQQLSAGLQLRRIHSHDVLKAEQKISIARSLSVQLVP